MPALNIKEINKLMEQTNQTGYTIEPDRIDFKITLSDGYRIFIDRVSDAFGMYSYVMNALIHKAEQQTLSE